MTSVAIYIKDHEHMDIPAFRSALGSLVWEYVHNKMQTMKYMNTTAKTSLLKAASNAFEDESRAFSIGSFRFRLLSSLFLLFSFCSSAQDSIVVRGQFVGNTKYAKVLMKKFDIGSFPVGGAVIKDEKFSITLPPDVPSGVYRFQYAIGEGEKYLDLVINGKEKDIAFTLEVTNESALPTFTASDENRNWYAYIDRNRSQLERVSLLNQLINAYPNANAAVVKAAEKEWDMERMLYLQNLETFKANMKGTWAYDMVANRPYFFSNPKDDPRLQDFEKREHFWDGFDANNTRLINTPLYTEHILNYLRYWMNPNMNFSNTEKIEGFKRAVDVIIRKFSGNEKTHAFVYKYLTLGFKEIGAEEILQYLDVNYKDLANRCFDEFEKTEFERRMTGYAAMRVGNIAPDFSLSVQSRKLKSLYKLKSQKILVVFWSSNCPHCLEELPEVNEWAGKQSAVKVVAVSVDTDSTGYFKTIEKFPNLIHSCDFKGWNTEAATRYFIAATPSFLLLDEKKAILGKYGAWSKLPLEDK